MANNNESGFFGKVKGLIFEEDSDPTLNRQQTPEKSIQVQNSVTLNQSPISPESSEKINQLLQHVETVSLSRKTAYTALLEAADKLKGVIPDENMRLNAAYAMVSGEQRTVQQMIQAIDIHIQDVDGEKLKFTTDANNHQKNKIGALEQAISNIEQTNIDLNKKIQHFLQEIESFKAQIVENQAKLVEANSSKNNLIAEFSTINTAFNTAVLNVKQKLESQRNLIQSTFSK